MVSHRTGFAVTQMPAQIAGEVSLFGTLVVYESNRSAMRGFFCFSSDSPAFDRRSRTIA